MRSQNQRSWHLYKSNPNPQFEPERLNPETRHASSLSALLVEPDECAFAMLGSRLYLGIEAKLQVARLSG